MEERKFYIDFRPVNGIQHGSPVDFFIPGDSPYLLSLKDTYLCTQWKVTKKGKTAQNDTEDAPVAPINLAHHTMWKHVDTTLQYRTVHSGNDYPYRCYIESVTGLSDPLTLETEYFYKDTIGLGHSTTTEGYESKLKKVHQKGHEADKEWIKANPYLKQHINSGFQTRFDRIKDMCLVLTQGPLHTDLCQQDKPLPPGIDVGFTLWPAEDDFMLMSKDDNDGWKLTVDKMWLRVCYLEIDHADTKELIQYPIQKVVMKSFNIPHSQTSISLENLYMGKVPSLVIAALVQSSAHAGDIHKSPFLFNNYNVGSAAFYVDGIPTPQPAFVISATDFTDPYYALVKASGGRMQSPHFPSLPEYPAGNMLLCFDIAQKVEHEAKSGHTRLHIELTKQPTESLTLVLYAILPQTMTIHPSKEVTLTD